MQNPYYSFASQLVHAKIHIQMSFFREQLAKDINNYIYTCISRENGIVKERVRVGRVRERELDFNLFPIFSFTFHIYSTKKRCIVILCLTRRRQVYDDGDR